MMDKPQTPEAELPPPFRAARGGVNMSDLPIWQLPVRHETGSSANSYIPSTMKFHCFVDYYSLCGKYAQDTDFYETDIESGEILSRPDIACKVCRKKWMKQYIREAPK